LLEEIIEAAHQPLPGVLSKEAILEHGEGAVIWRGFVHGQANEPFDHQVIVD